MVLIDLLEAELPQTFDLFKKKIQYLQKLSIAAYHKMRYACVMSKRVLDLACFILVLSPALYDL